MNPDGNSVVVPPTNEDIIEPVDGQQDPLDLVTDVEELRKAAKANRAIASRYKKAKNAKAPEPTPTPTAPSVPVPSASPTDVEETVLLAQGMPDALMKELKVIAKVRGVSLIRAQSDPLFVATKENFDKEKKSKDAGMPSSRGSGGVTPKKDVNTPGLSREEHMALFKERQGQ